MEEGGAAARQAGDEERALDRLGHDVGRAALGGGKVEEVGEEAEHVPAEREAADQAERCLRVGGLEQAAERFGDLGFAEIVEAGAAARGLHQAVRGERDAEIARGERERIGGAEGRAEDRHGGYANGLACRARRLSRRMGEG